MKLLQVNASYKPAYVYGGPTMSVSKLSEEMAQAGNTVEVFTTTANGADELAVAPNIPTYVDGIKVTYFKRITGDHTHFSPALLKRLWKKVCDFDVVHIHAWWNLVSVLSCWVALRRGVPVIVSPRGTLSAYSFTNKNDLPKKIIHNLIGKSLLKRSTIHVTSDREKEAMELLVKPKHIFNIPNFIALPDKVSNAPAKADDHLKLIFLSRIEEKKGLEILFDALANVTIPYHLTIAGDGDAIYVDGLKSLAEKNGISGQISWVGFQTENKFNLLQQHDLMVLPSYDENFGNVVIESLSVGTAVLISDNVGLAAYVEQNNFGWVCENDPASFAGVIGQLNTENVRLKSTREKAPAKIRADFDEKKLVDQYMDMYNQTVSNG
ncbi:MAG TPA: glycosyltransferase [Mucilaginibacter sp.]|nr:glycosyltransferase [Mucilaginibacter sp.]